MSEAKIYTADEVNRLFKQLIDHKNEKLILIRIPMKTINWNTSYGKVYSISFATNTVWNMLTGNTDFLTKPEDTYLAYWTNAGRMYLRIIYDYSEFKIIPTFNIYQSNSLLLARPSIDGTTETSEAILLNSGINYFEIKH